MHTAGADGSGQQWRFAGPRTMSEASCDDTVSWLLDLLHWKDVWRSGRALGGGLYAILVAQTLCYHGAAMRPVTGVASLCLAVLVFNAAAAHVALVANCLSRLKSGSGKPAAASGPAADGVSDSANIASHALTSARLSLKSRLAGVFRGDASPSQAAKHPAGADAPQRDQLLRYGARADHSSQQSGFRIFSSEDELFHAVCQLQQRMLDGVGPVVAGVLVLLSRLLAGATLVHATLTLAFLWLLLVLSESGALSLTGLALLCYAAAFTLPAAYQRSSSAVDAVVVQLGHAGHALLQRSERRFCVLALAASVVAFYAVEVSFVLRVSLSSVVLTSMLLWHVRGRAVDSTASVTVAPPP